MPSLAVIRRAAGRLIGAVCFFLGGVVSASAQGLTVESITIEGGPVQGVAGVLIRLRGAASAQARSLKVGEAIPSGAEIRLPSSVRIELISTNGNRLILHPGARFLAGIATGSGESHQPLGGRIDFSVRKAFDFFNIRYDRIMAAVKGTEFSVEIDPAKRFSLSVTDGIVEVERQVQVTFTSAAESDALESDGIMTGRTSIRVAEELKRGESRNYRLNLDEYLAEFGNYGEAEAYFRRALTEAEAGGNESRILRAVQNLIAIHWGMGRPEAMRELEDRCISLARAQSDAAGEAVCLNHSGIARIMQREYHEAIDYHQRALVLQERLYADSDHPDIAWSLNNLGAAYRPSGKLQTAIGYHEKALAMRERLYAQRDHPDLAQSQLFLGTAYHSLREHRKAIEYYEKALAMRERLYAERDHPDLAQSQLFLGTAYHSLGGYRKAVEYYEKSLAMRMRLHTGRDHPGIAASLNRLGNAYHALREFSRAVEHYERSLAMRERLHAGRDHPTIAQSLRNLARAHDRAGNDEAAARYRERATAMQRRLTGPQ